MTFCVARMRWAASRRLAIASSRTESSLVTLGSLMADLRDSSGIHRQFIRRSSPGATVESARRLLQGACTTILHYGRRVRPGNPLGHPRPSRGLAWRPVLVRGTRSWVHPPLSGLAKLGGQRSNPSHQSSASLAFLHAAVQSLVPLWAAPVRDTVLLGGGVNAG